MLLQRKKIRFLSIILSLSLLLYSGFGAAGIPLALADGLTTSDQTNLSLSNSVKLNSPGPNSIEPLADMINPTIDLSSLWISRTSAVPGDTVSIKVKAADDSSGVKEVAFELCNEHGGSKYYVISTPGQDGYYQMDFPVTETTHSGQWYLEDITVSDHNSNHSSYSSPDVDLGAANFSVASNADITPPTLDLSTLSVSRNTAEPGDIVTVKVKAFDDFSGVKEVAFELNNETGSFATETDDSVDAEGYYQMDFLVSAQTHAGNWFLNYVTVIDHNENSRTYSSYIFDLSAANFTVTSLADMTPPSIDLSSLSVNRTLARPGDTLAVKLKASDDSSGVKDITVELKNENGGYLSITDNKVDADRYYEFQLLITEDTHPGNWYLSFITVADNNSNYKSYLSQTFDLSAADFFVEDSTVPVNQINATYVTGNTTWTYKTIDRDVYVGPDAILTINGDVKINGNLYILGIVISYGDLTVNDLYANSVSDESSAPLHQSSFNIRAGNQTISNSIITPYPVSSIPVEIYSSNKVSETGVLPLLEGATLPIAELYIDGVKTAFNYNGTFSIPNYQVGYKLSLKFKMVDIFGKDHFYTYALDQGDRSPEPKIDTLSGLDRYKTAVQVSQAGFSNAETAILVRSDDFPDALSAGPLAYALNAPILLTKTNVLNYDTEQELARLKVKHIILLGGESAINTSVEAALAGSGYQVSRIQGANRFETAVAVGNQVIEKNGTAGSIILTSSSAFADALSAGSYASKEGYPILLTNGTVMNPVNTSFLTSHGIKNITIVGGSAVVSYELENQLNDSGYHVTRISGSDRSATSANLAAQFFPNPSQAVIASGWSFADALSAAPYAAKLNAPILLLTKDPLNASVEAYLSNTDIYNIKVIGGDSAISSAVISNLLGIISK